LWPTCLHWKSKATQRVLSVSIKFKGTVLHGTGGVLFFMRRGFRPPSETLPGEIQSFTPGSPHPLSTVPPEAHSTRVAATSPPPYHAKPPSPDPSNAALALPEHCSHGSLGMRRRVFDGASMGVRWGFEGNQAFSGVLGIPGLAFSPLSLALALRGP